MTRPIPPARLSRDRLDGLDPAIRRPTYQPREHGVGVVHLGVGAFHRAHQAVYLDDLLERRGGDWRILGVSLRSPAARDRLRPQDGLYTVAVRSTDREERRVIGALADVVHNATEAEAVLAAMTAPATRLVSLTVTEKGYGFDPVSGGADARDPDIAHDLAAPVRPRSAAGVIVEALARRRERGVLPFTALSCDNLSGNGRTLRAIVLDMARRRDPALAEWIAEAGRFPSSVVDRIVPATAHEDLAAFERETGVSDAGLVVTEPFSQWVVEDAFVGERPELEAVGVALVGDVAPFERAKLRLLNGSHSAIAYLGLLAGCAHVHEVMADPCLAAFVAHLMTEEVAPTLGAAPGLDMAAYAASLRRRFANTALRHRTRQIAADGTRKLPQRIVAPLLERRRAGLPTPALTLVVAAWMRHTVGRDGDGERHDVDDPHAARLERIWREHPSIDAAVGAILGLKAVFGPELAADPSFRTEVGAALRLLIERGPREAAHRVLARPAHRPEP